MARKARIPSCHPNQPHQAKGLCKKCYDAACVKRQRTTDPIWREKQARRMREWRERNPERVRATNIARYGITLDAFEALFEAQNGQCAICRLPLVAVGGPMRNEKAHVDHCHRTNTVRGLLCMQCNVMLGAANDRPEVLRAAADYLDEIGG